MAGYNFKLQKLLDYKISMEEQKKNELSLAIKRLEEEKGILEELLAKRKDMDSKFQKKTSEGIEVNELKLLVNYIDYYKRRIKSQRINIRMAEDYLESCRDELIKASQEKKMMESQRN
jgi:flagellar FliJ protein